jgi:hypothetical protein|tara:strand:+ start:701 stop:2752 length:2052 start_codon:yes stop_codon:yes gene_type:complete
MNKFTFTPEQAFCYISQEVLNSNDFRLLDRFAENSVDNSTDYTSIVSLQTKLSDPLLPNKPLLLAAFQGSLLVIPNLFTHEEGKGKPSFAAAFKSRTSASILKMKAISDHKHTIDVPPLAEILKLDTLSNLKQAFIDHDDDDDNEIEGYSCILVDKSFISILFREGKDSTPALDILSHYTEIARRDESLAKSPWFLRLYGFLSQLIKDSTEGTSSTPDAIDGDFINPIEKQFKSTIKIVKSSITTFNNSDFKIPLKKSTSIDSSPVSSNASLKDDDDSSIPIVGTGLAPFDLDQDEVSKVPESVTVVPDTKSVATINFEDQKGTFNCTGSDLLKLIASSSHSTASKSIGSLMSEESKLWIIALDRTISGATRELSPSLTDAIKATSFQDVSNSLKWKMMNLFGATRTIDAPQEQMIKNFLSNKITSDNRMATNPEDMVGLSIACFKPEHRAFTHKKDKFQFFIADNETDFLEQLEAFVIFLRSILLPDSFIVLKTIELENDFKQSRQGLRNQFTLYKESFGLYLTRVIHNSFTQFAIKAKWDPNAMPTGLDLSWITREIQSGKDYNLVAPVKRKEYDAPKSKSAKAPASKKSRGTENLTKQFTDWHLDSSKSTYGEHFGAQPIKDMNPPIPTFEGKKLCIKSIFGNCSKKNCTFSHARVKKGDKSMNEWISKNKLPITFIGSE